MNFLVHDEDGLIVQSNKIYMNEGDYPDTLRRHGHSSFISVSSSYPLAPDEYWVSKGELTSRPEMPFFCERTHFKADGSDAAVVRGLPEGVRVTITATGGIVVASSEPVSGGFIEVPSPIPCEYDVLFEKFPYRPKHIKLVAEL